MDLDHFKRVNDQQGHVLGDQVLVEFAKLIRGRARAGDDLVRMGGEEFCLILRDTTAEHAAAIADRLREATSKLAEERGWAGTTITMSAGVAGSDENHESHRAMLIKADQALYAAKKAGRDRVCLAL